MATIQELRSRVTDRKQAEIESEVRSEAQNEVNRLQDEISGLYGTVDQKKAEKAELESFLNPPAPEQPSEEIVG